MSTEYKDPELYFVWLEVSDLVRSVDFYRDNLGFPVQDDAGNFAIVHLANTKLYLAPGTPLGMSMYIAISVDDIDAMYKRMLRYEMNVAEPINEGWARYINLIDPDGYRLVILQPAEEEEEETTSS